MAKPALGRGLGALLGGAKSNEAGAPQRSEAGRPGDEHAGREPVRDAGDAAGGVWSISLDLIRAGKRQPRRDFPKESIDELADSMRAQGVLQPLLVRKAGEVFELIAGERRLRAARQAGLREVPVVVREVDDRTALEMMLVENLQREDLNPIDEALGFQQLIEQFQLRQDEAAAKVGKSRAAIANALRLLRLNPEVRAWVREGRLSVGHAKVILGIDDQGLQKLVAEEAIRRDLNVRETAERVSAARGLGVAEEARRPKPAPVSGEDPHVSAIQESLQERLGTKVSLRYNKGKGAVEIKFFSDEDLERVLQVLGIKVD
ncbi:MAG: ParB/RepB/Spo0J family partition protein [Verrucomicrobia bacterium]|nr:ParB/RepB/Spo0J family partition protein [Verrucomicrobiota bacterium]MCF7707865.1 ParB/RepB/Spo0J family partition protein [Verrucomicrobiota bacterium]